MSQNSDVQTYSINQTATVNNPDSLTTYFLQKNDVDNGTSMFDMSLNTLYNYSAYDGSQDLSNLDSFLNNGVDNSVTQNNTRLVSVGTSNPDIASTYTNIKTDSQYILEEKTRIKDQSTSKAYQRDDHFAIGTVYLTIPPTQISVSDEAHNYRFGSLRSPGEVVLTSGRTTTRIDLEIVFNGIDDINNKLRPLLAQFKTTPFLPIESEYLKKILNPFDRKLVDKGELASDKTQLHEMQKREDTLDELIAVSSESNTKNFEMLDTVDNMYKKGWIDADFKTALIQGDYLTDPDSIPPEELTEGDYYTDRFGNQKVSLKNFIARHMDVSAPKSPDMMEITRNLTEIDNLSQEIDAIKSKSKELNIKNAEDRFVDRQLMCVLSQMSISTMPGFPESLGCRLSLFVFNYDPFSLDCTFIYGYNNNSATPDITKCDLFIDWYTTRWLATRYDPSKPSLGWYTADEKTTFTYATKLKPIDKENITNAIIQTKDINITEGISISGITVSIKNIIQFLPILSSKTPTCQYMGSLNNDVQFVMESTDDKKVLELSKMIDRVRGLSRTNNRVTRNNFIYVDNNLLSFLAMPYFTIDNYTVDTVPGSPGLQSISLSLIEFKPGQEELQDLTRDGVTSQDDVLWVAKWMLGKAHDYITTGGKTGTNKQYEEIYTEVMDGDEGWFRKKNSMVSRFMAGIGGQADELKAVRMNIKAVVEEINTAIAQESAINTNTFLGQLIINPEKALDYDLYSEDFANSLNNDTEGNSFYNAELNNMTKVAAVMQRDDIVRRILQVSRNPEINNELNKHRKKEDLDAGKKYCYPDLELPRYGEIPNGFRFINTDLESGVQGSDLANPQPVQSDYAMVDPDFFFCKGSLWKNVDNDSGLFTALKNSITTYMKLAEGNQRYREEKALDENEMAKLLYNMHKRRVEDTTSFLDTPIPTVSTGDAIDGQWVKVLAVTSGNEVTVTDGKKTYPLVLDGYRPQSSDTDGASAAAATEALSSYVFNKKVRVDLGTKQTDSNGKYLATIMTEDLKNVNKLMEDRSPELNLSSNVTQDDPLASANKRDFYMSHDNAVRVSGKRNILHKIYDATGVGEHPLVLNVAKVGAVALTASPEEAESKTRDALGQVLMSVGYSGPYKENKLTNDIGSLPGEGVFKPTPNNGVNRFDREAYDNVKLITERVRQSQKDNTLRMSRAFPTFKVYFIEEDMPEWQRWDDKYDYRAVASIDITKSRTEAADVAVVKFFNTRGTLDRSYFGLHDAQGNYIDFQPQEAIEANKQETREEQTLEQFILKPGTVIKIKMGYSSDPDLLDTVFTGMIAEVSGGDMIEVVAQGFGVELMIPVPESHYKVHAASAYKILDKIIKNPAVMHFGKTKWFAENTDTTKVLFRRSIPDPKHPGEYIGASWWRNWGPARFILGVRDDSRDNNIWVPENSWLYNMSHGGTQTLITKDKSIWDMFRDMQRRMPGYITTVLPFDNRATIYFGPADFLYWATSEQKDAQLAWKLNYKSTIDKTDEQKIKEMTDGGEMTYLSADDFNNELSKLGSHLTALLNTTYKDNSKYQGYVRNYVKALNGEDVFTAFSNDPAPRFLTRIEDIVGSDAYSTTNAVSFANMAAQSDLTSKDADLKNIYDFTASVMQSNYTGLFSTNGTSGNNIKVQYVGEDGLYVGKDGKIYLESGALKWYNDTRRDSYENNNPARKLVRQYHYKDSFHHIISNSIVATSQYLYNRVTVEFGGDSTKKKNGETKDTSPNYDRVSAQVDDDIWPERVKEKIVHEKNANTKIVAWNYALGNLWEEMRKMYSGHLIILGDPSIKPYDLIMMSDYFTQMHGPVEVEQVTHHFSPDTGFVTTIVPNLVCHVNNSMQKGSLVVAGAYMDATTKFVESVRSVASFYGLLGGPGAWIGNHTSNVAFWMTGLSESTREPFSFSPLMYANRPFIAGVEGMMKTSLYECISGNIRRFIIQRNRIEQTLSEIWDRSRRLISDNMQHK